jgi:hypothetical protein
MTTLTRRAALALPAALGGLALPRISAAEPRVSAAFPSFSAHDLNGGAHSQRELTGRRRFVAAITGMDASEPMRAWLDQAESRLGRSRGNVHALVALELSFIAFDGIVRSQARAHTPSHRWPFVWMERDGSLTRQLGLPNGHAQPWAYILEPNGTVSRWIHGPVSHPDAPAFWTALMAP